MVTQYVQSLWLLQMLHFHFMFDHMFSSGPSTTVRITGRRLSKPRTVRSRPNRIHGLYSKNGSGGSDQTSVDERGTETITSVTNSKSNGHLDCADSDEPSEPIGVVYLKKGKQKSPSSGSLTTGITDVKHSYYRVCFPLSVLVNFDFNFAGV